MPNTIIRNGAVVASMSHVVSDVPPYAIVGGNPAKIIGYRFPRPVREKLQEIQWWYWPQQQIKRDTYFAFVDFYEKYCDYPAILESFLNQFVGQEDKELVLFVQDGIEGVEISDKVIQDLENVIAFAETNEAISCHITLKRGSSEDAKDCFINCKHFIMSRTYWCVPFTCLADRLGMEIISGADSVIQYEKKYNMVRE